MSFIFGKEDSKRVLCQKQLINQKWQNYKQRRKRKQGLMSNYAKPTTPKQCRICKNLKKKKSIIRINLASTVG